MTAKNNNPGSKPITHTVVIERVIQAPCRLVYHAWTDPKQMVQWFSPAEIDCQSVTADVKVGGSYRIHMISQKGDHIAIGKYLEIIPHQRLKLTWEWENYRMPESTLTVDFEDLGQTTRLTLTHAGLPDAEDAAGHTEGWTSAVEKFARLMAENKIKT